MLRGAVGADANALAPAPAGQRILFCACSIVRIDGGGATNARMDAWRRTSKIKSKSPLPSKAGEQSPNVHTYTHAQRRPQEEETGAQSGCEEKR
eukprot:COSAG06_NODE_29295_length_559_cov_0.808696_1_plen_93_part_10